MVNNSVLAQFTERWKREHGGHEWYGCWCQIFPPLYHWGLI